MQQQQSPPEKPMITCPNPKIDHLDGHSYLFGYPIAHSLSPLFHQTIYDHLNLRWSQLPLPSTNMQQFLELLSHPKCYGASVTMPHKLSIIPHLHALAPEARAVGACNTIIKQPNGQLLGTNTDVYGVRGSFFHNVSRPDLVFQDRPGMVIGGGGAARSAVYALVHFLHCKRVYLVNRDADEVRAVMEWCTAQGYGSGLLHVATAAQAAALEGPGAIVACVPNFPPVTEAEKEARAITEVFLNKPHKGAILEMCYHPKPWTEIAELADRAGWQVILGTEAVIYQGLEQDRLWTGRSVEEMPVEEVKRVIAEELSKARL